ncbi:MAG: c-type cytochrome, partial [Methyloprofundus sp.]|nr:c-type cytochrome [Methyloprofundus sp.]
MPTKRGYQLFKSFGCVSCHQGVAVGGNFQEKLGVVIPYFKEDPEIQQDLGRYHLSLVEEEKFEFKVPSLRNVARTAPYLHDGSIETLGEVVKIMAK